jgi:hypothetical protein
MHILDQHSQFTAPTKCTQGAQVAKSKAIL